MRVSEELAQQAHAQQFRADGVTPYITHPRRVAELAMFWNEILDRLLDPDFVFDVAILHDVFEDSDITPEQAHARGIGDDVIAMVLVLTNPKGVWPVPESHYQRIEVTPFAELFKAADRAASLEDALLEVQAKRNIPRWQRYAINTQKNILPILTTPLLRAEIKNRLGALISAIEVA